MTGGELKEAFITGAPVITGWNTITNIKGYISAIIYRKNQDGKIQMSAEIHDFNANSVVIADAAKVRFKEV